MNDTENIAPLKLILEGRFWDSQIYMGALYLFGIDGQVHTIDWDRLISEFTVPADLALPMQCAFSRSDYLYEHQRDLIQDPQMREVFQSKFIRLAKHHQTPRMADWRYYLANTTDSPFPFPHLDATIYMKGFFSVSENGVYVMPARQLQSKSQKKPTPMKMWDCPILSVDASYGALALAAGPEGLFEFELDDWVRGDPRQAKLLDRRPCDDCSWTYYSIVGSSHKEGGIFAEYITDDAQDEPKNSQDFEPSNVGRSWRDAPRIQRQFEKLVGPKDIFEAEGYCWGGKDKICQASEGTMTVARYSPWENNGGRLQVMGRIDFDSENRNPIGGAVAPFGSIIELDKSIVVVRSDDEILTIPGVPTNWRVFNRSKQYENQLHVIYENRLEIYSFNHDYFIDQEEKLSGVCAYGSSNVLKKNGKKSLNLVMR